MNGEISSKAQQMLIMALNHKLSFAFYKRMVFYLCAYELMQELKVTHTEKRKR